MTVRKNLLATIAALLLVTIAAIIVPHLAALSTQHNDVGNTGDDCRSVTDLAGREISVPRKISRLIALGPGALRLVAYLGATDRIVGIEDMEKRMERDLYVRPYARALDDDFLSRPIIGPGGPGALPDPEKILICRPQLIVAVGIDPAQLDNIQAKTGVPTIYLSYGQLGDWQDEAQRSLTLLGEILDLSPRAAEINSYIAAQQRELKTRTAGIDRQGKPMVYFGGISYKGSHGLTSTEAGYTPAQMVAANNLADTLGKQGHFFVDKEQLLVWNPDFIFVDAASRLHLDRDFNDNRQFYRLLKAGRSGRVLSLLPYNYYNTNIELALLNACFVGKTLYPERFSDVNLADKTREIMQTFLGLTPADLPPAYRCLQFPESGPVEWR